MAARNPTSYTQWIDEEAIKPGKSILASTMDNTLDDQEFIIDQPFMVLSHVFIDLATTSATYVTKMIRYIKNKDMCDVSDVSNDEISCEVYAYVQGETNAISGMIRISSTATASNSVEVTMPINTSTETWIKAGSDLNVKTNDTEDTITVEMKETSATGDDIMLWGLFIMAKAT